jgi:hypothetical protein
LKLSFVIWLLCFSIIWEFVLVRLIFMQKVFFFFLNVENI